MLAAAFFQINIDGIASLRVTVEPEVEIMQAAFDGAERAARLREKRKDTHQRIDLWLSHEVFAQLDDLRNYYGVSRLAMLEKLVVDRHAAWSEADDAPAPVAMTFRGRKLGYHRTKPCPTCTGQPRIQAFADTNGICPVCRGTRVVPADDE